MQVQSLNHGHAVKTVGCIPCCLKVQRHFFSTSSQHASSFLASSDLVHLLIVPSSWNRDGGTAATSYLSTVFKSMSRCFDTDSRRRNSTSVSMITFLLLSLNRLFFILLKVTTICRGIVSQKLLLRPSSSRSMIKRSRAVFPFCGMSLKASTTCAEALFPVVMFKSTAGTSLTHSLLRLTS